MEQIPTLGLTSHVDGIPDIDLGRERTVQGGPRREPTHPRDVAAVGAQVTVDRPRPDVSGPRHRIRAIGPGTHGDGHGLGYHVAQVVRDVDALINGESKLAALERAQRRRRLAVVHAQGRPAQKVPDDLAR
uniref:Uncharacterized protein n=1 Tax=uncultured marine virus TaxID=186617 RepID=A0A0F7L5B6_9VIRU|nr:hypothetical protein [uncultured marine virus]